MHFHTTPELVATVATGKLAAPGVSLAAGLTVLAIMAVLSVAANWVASLVVAQHYATIGKAALAFIGQVAGCIVFAFFGGLCYFFLEGWGASEPAVVGALVILAILFLVTMIAIPMQVYDIDVVRSICFLALSWLLGFVISNVASPFVGGKAGISRMPATMERIMSNLKLRTTGQPDPEFAKRKADLDRQYERLEIRRRYLPANDHRAYADYERDRAAFQRQVEQFQSDFGD